MCTRFDFKIFSALAKESWEFTSLHVANEKYPFPAVNDTREEPGAVVEVHRLAANVGEI
jgi:hypothetical protein